jgi:hypothetical protein
VEKNWPMLTTTTTKTMEIKYFKVKHKVLKNSLRAQLWSDFEKFLLKSQARQISGKNQYLKNLWDLSKISPCSP